MPELHVRNLPADLHERLKEQAASEGRSMSAEVVMLLRRTLMPAGRRVSQQRAVELLQEIQRRSRVPEGARRPSSWCGRTGTRPGERPRGCRRLSRLEVGGGRDRQHPRRCAACRAGVGCAGAGRTRAPRWQVGNGLRKRVAQGILTTDDALSAMEAVEALELELFGGQERWFRALRAALDWTPDNLRRAPRAPGAGPGHGAGHCRSASGRRRAQALAACSPPRRIAPLEPCTARVVHCSG